MTEPRFLTLDEVLEIHAYQIAQFGGAAGMLNMGALESAIAMPAQAFGGQYVHEDLAAMAAAYLFHIARNHPFEDGNKRTAMHAALVFLELNGHEVDVPVQDAEKLTLSVASGTADKQKAAAFFRALLGE